MTAEVVILNKSAVALAADSTMTINTGASDRKTYNSVNKLFNLSKYQPVGAMIYGDASFMGVPWEVVLKEYRRGLQNTSFETLREYLSNLVRFLEQAPYLRESQSQEVWRASFRVFHVIATAVLDRCGNSLVSSPAQVNATETADAVVRDWDASLADRPTLSLARDDFAAQLQSRYEKELREARDDAFADSNVVLSDYAMTTLPALAARAITAGLIPATSGLVIAGFGTGQVFPEVVTISPLLLACDRLLFAENAGKCYAVSVANEAALIPFAQQDVVTTFLDGIDPQIQQIVDSSVSQLLEDFPGVAMDTLKVDPAGKDAEVAELRTKMNQVKADFFKRVADHKQEYHTNPLIDVIAVLPKDELAATAESLVSLTAIKRKMSLEIETVGGPIDVAVISKGDGFVWIKRKHYFEPELNPQFISNYLGR